MNISLQKYCQEGNIKHFITSFFIFFNLSFSFQLHGVRVQAERRHERCDSFLLQKLVCSFPSGMTQNFKI